MANLDEFDKEVLKRIDSIPKEAKKFMAGDKTFKEETRITIEKYGIKNDEAGNICEREVSAIMLGYSPLYVLPTSIEKCGKVPRRIALQAAIRLSRHLLKPFSQYVDIGNVDAYIEEWKDELEGMK